jgi:hypothetical protein
MKRLVFLAVVACLAGGFAGISPVSSASAEPFGQRAICTIEPITITVAGHPVTTPRITYPCP